MKGSTPRSAIEMSVDDLLSTDKSFLRKAWIKHVYFLSNLVNSRISDEPDPVSAERESIPSLGEFARRTKRIESGATKAKSEKIGRIDQSTAVKLAQAFIEFCIEDGDTSSQDLTKSLAAIIENVVSSRRLGEELLKDNPEQAKELNKHLEISLEHMVQVMMTLQF
ncbi:MAG: hypothetical protein OEX00_06135, partial [Gammaproteobacteria bacterium]|nr:hypothetical protein [Gammaproteobacteria bacterium]